MSKSMSRMSISFSGKNAAWIEKQVQAGEYSSKSELVNDLLRRTREQDAAQRSETAMLEDARNSGVSSRTTEQIRQDVLDQWRLKRA